MSNQSRKARGMRTQLVVSQWFQAHGWPFATSTGAGRQGVDIENMAGLAPEVKARKDLDLTGWLRQAASNADGGLPFVVARPNGYGEARVAEWPVVLTFAEFTTLLRDAGYGDPVDTNTESAKQPG